MKDITVELLDEHVHKYSTGTNGYKRAQRELEILKGLNDSMHTPNVIRSSDRNDIISIKMQSLAGKNAKQIIGMQDEYATKPIGWDKAKEWIRHYVKAEMDLLDRGYLYRDLNLEHIIFNNDKVVLIDLESAVVGTYGSGWKLQDMRGTWETMAPEEFPGYGWLSARTATYRVAVVSHLILTGKLPFKRFPTSRARTHHWRRTHAAEVDQSLSKSTRRVFRAALARKQVHRYKDPGGFFEHLARSYEPN